MFFLINVQKTCLVDPEMIKRNKRHNNNNNIKNNSTEIKRQKKQHINSKYKSELSYLLHWIENVTYRVQCLTKGTHIHMTE